MLQVKLIVTGDDFGYCPRRNQGIVDCFLAGAVSNVSLLVNGSAAADAAKLARRSIVTEYEDPFPEDYIKILDEERRILEHNLSLPGFFAL